jgi:hypothetical protein
MLEKIEEQQEMLDEHQRREMRLSGDKYGRGADSWRPPINLKIDRDPTNEGCFIFIRIDETMGHPVQYIELSPDEAGILARHLLELANYVEAGHPDGIEIEESQE